MLQIRWYNVIIKTKKTKTAYSGGSCWEYVVIYASHMYVLICVFIGSLSHAIVKILRMEKMVRIQSKMEVQ